MTARPGGVVFVTSSRDRVNYVPVAQALESAGCAVVVFEADRVASGAQPFAWELRGHRARVMLGGKWIDLADIAAGWWRKPQWLELERSDAALRQSLEHEVLRLVQEIWALVPEGAWLNEPARMREGASLARQIAVASELGFTTPPTLVTNDWVNLDILETDEIAFKVLGGGLVEQGRFRVLYTQRLRAAQARLQPSVPYPGIIQPYFHKSREWRITVVDEEAYCASVCTTERAANDWREHQFTNDVRFVAADPPLEIRDRCVALVGRLALGFAAIDLIETPEGDFVFLEANPNGQYGWLDNDLNLGIGAGITRGLLRRAAWL